MNPNQMQAAEDEEAGIQEQEEDIDYDALYGGLDIDIPKEKSLELEKSYREILGDIAKQGTKEFLIGAGGAYGDLLELAPKSPGIEARHASDFEALERLNDPNSSPSLADLYSLSDEGISSEGFKLPSSENLRSASEAIGGPGQAETTQGRYVGRIAKNYGASVATGNLNPAGAILSGAAGQTVEERGGGHLAQAAAEIIGMLAGDKGGKVLARKAGMTPQATLGSSKKAIQEEINRLRALGYTDEEITLAINRAHKNASKLASKGEKTEEAFEKFSKKSDELVSDILSTEIEGYEKGSEYVHQLSRDAYGKVIEGSEKIKLKNLDKFVDSVESSVKEAKKAIGNEEEGLKFINSLVKDTFDVIDNPTAEEMILFYQRLNKIGKWVKPSTKERIIENVKNSIKDSFKSSGKEGIKLAEEFEKVNSGVQKAYRAQDLRKLVDSAHTQDGFNYNKLSKIFDKPENVKLFEQVLGPQQAKNIQQISRVGKEVKDFDKAWKASHYLSTGGNLALGATGTYYLLQGDWEGLAKTALLKGGKKALSKIVEKSLTDPKMQNLMIRGIHAVKTSSPRTMKIVQDQLQKYMEEEGIDIEM